jgi:N-glycosidase YbiA
LKKQMTVRFYRTNEIPYGVFSNFSKHGFTLDGHYWPTVEHYYQAQKFVGTPQAEEVRLAHSARSARELGNDRQRPLRSDWDEVREEVMWRAICRKFEEHPDLRDILLGTGDQELVEASPYDSFWGEGPQGDGKNQLGKQLMRLRDMLRTE